MFAIYRRNSCKSSRQGQAKGIFVLIGSQRDVVVCSCEESARVRSTFPGKFVGQARVSDAPRYDATAPRREHHSDRCLTMSLQPSFLRLQPLSFLRHPPD
jgi:hypothetical protein